ncbi:MAG: hypothetical protein RMM31_01035 [Anaerolineae bacterium]|nr:hypothetical protein [Thermoflexales bacterium]MDW8394809.1 hypothetical protein [Anaerolineae bacterium]
MIYCSYSTIHVVNGDELGDSPQIVARTVTRRGGEAETLLIFLDFPNASPSTCADLARTLVDGFSRAPGGVTAALRLAISLVNDRAAQLNRGALPQRRVEGSLCCALVGKDSVLLAQAGPSLAFARAANGAFEVIQPDFKGAPQIVGVAQHIDVYFNNFAAQVGDTFVLTGARSTEGVSVRLVEVCMSKGDARMVAGYLNANVKQGRMVGIALSVDRSAAEGAPMGEQVSARPQVSTPKPRSQPSPLPLHSRPTEPTIQAPRLDLGGISETMRAAATQAAHAAQRSFSALSSKLLPDDPPTAVLPTPSHRSITLALASIALILPVFIAAAVGVLYFQFSGEAERLQRRANAQALIEQAQRAQTPEEIRTRWERAIRAIGEYEALTPQDFSTFAAARREARQRLDKLSQIERIRPVLLVEFGTQARRRISASALGVYVLDPDSSTAEYYLLDRERFSVLGNKVAINFTSPPGRLADIAWATAANNRWRTEGAVLFSEQQVFEYSSATARAVPMPVPANPDAAPVKVQSGELFNNTVYLLDVGVGQIWRYPLSGDTLSAGNAYFRSPYRRLQDSVDFTIDGAIYVLQRNNAIHKYFNRQPVPFNLMGLPEPFQRAVALSATGLDQNTGSLLVLDASTGGVFELSKNGQFIRQLRGEADEFVGAVDLSFNEASRTLYVATLDRLYVTKLE